MITQYLRASSAPKLPRPSASSDKTALKASHLEMGITIRQVTNSSGTISYRLEIPARVAGARRLLQFHANAGLTCSMLAQPSHEVLFTHYRPLLTPEAAGAFYALLPAAAGVNATS